MFQTPAYRTARTVGTGQSNPGDVHRLRRALKRTGHGRFPGQGAPNVTPGLMEAIKRFQTEYGLEPDAVILPGGPTERALSMALGARNYEGDPAMHALRDAFARRAKAGLAFRPHPENRDGGLWRTVDGRNLTDAQADAVVDKAVPSPAMRRSLLGGGAGMDVLTGGAGRDRLAAAGPGTARGGANRANPVTPEISQRRARVANPARPTGVLELPRSDGRFLDSVEHDMRERFVEDWRKSGLPQAADNLERYLDGTGQKLTFTREEARTFRPIREAEQENKDRIENQTFLAKTRNTEFNEALKSLKDGTPATDLPEDDWRVGYNGRRAAAGAIGLVPGEKDFYRAFGRTPFATKTKLKAVRKGDTIYISGTVTHEWKDTYDFHPPQPGSEALTLQKAGRARPFDIGAKWTQRVRGTVQHLPNGELTDPQVEWTEEDR